MIEKRMRVSMAVTLALLFVMLAFGRGRLAWLYDDVGTAAAGFVAGLSPSPTVAADGGGEAGSGRAVRDASPPQESSPGRAGESAPAAEPEPAPEVPAAAAPDAPDPQAVRDSAAAEIDALDPLHDELIAVLEAIQAAQTDRWEKRWAGNRVTRARITKRHDRSRLEPDAAAEEAWRVRNARRLAGTIKARLERELEEARANLARMRASP